MKKLDVTRFVVLSVVLVGLLLYARGAFAQTRTFSESVLCGQTTRVSIPGPAAGVTTATISIDGSVDRIRAVENVNSNIGSDVSWSAQTASVQVALSPAGPALVSSTLTEGRTTFPPLAPFDGIFDYGGSSGATTLLSGLYSVSSSGPSAPWQGPSVLLWIRTSDTGFTVTGTSGMLNMGFSCSTTVNGTVTYQ